MPSKRVVTFWLDMAVRISVLVAGVVDPEGRTLGQARSGGQGVDPLADLLEIDLGR
jgi:hypothetical protein